MNTALRSLLWGLLVLLLLPQLTAATPPPTLFDEAGAAYSRQDYDRAIELYEELCTSYGYTPNLLYNLAGSYLAAGRPGKAILNYERAALLAPGNSDIAGNLKAAQEAQGLFEPEQNSVEKGTHLLEMEQWLWLALAATTVLVLVFSIALKKTLSRRALISWAALCLVIITACATAATLRYQHWRGLIVVEPESRLAISPFAGAAPVGELKEGSRVVSIGSHNNFIWVVDDGGRRGWLPQNVVEPIIP